MSKKILALFLILCLFITAFTGCSQKPAGDNPPTSELTNEELSAAYKQVAVSTWVSVGIDDPTVSVEPAQTFSVIVPDAKVEISFDGDEKDNIIMNSKSMGGLLYLLSSLYQNEYFALTNGIAKFDATVSMGTETFNQNYTITTSLNKATGKVFVEVLTLVAEVNSEQYSCVEIDYNFNTSTLKSFRFYSYINILDATVDMALTADGKYMWYESVSSQGDDVAQAIIQNKEDFNTRANSVEKLTTDFSEEMQIYFDVIQSLN